MICIFGEIVDGPTATMLCVEVIPGLLWVRGTVALKSKRINSSQDKDLGLEQQIRTVCVRKIPFS